VPRLLHGATVTAPAIEAAQAELAVQNADIALGFAAAQSVDLQAFDYLFLDLQADPNNLLPQLANMPELLKQLGRTMEDPGSGADPGDSPIPAAYTYLGQFVDHDITLEVVSATLGSMDALLDPAMVPLTLSQVRSALSNSRTATLDLDSLYTSPAPRDPNNNAKMLIGLVSDLGDLPPPLSRPPGKSDDNDLPREPRNSDIVHDRAALIGDPRNDENTIVAQLHLALLKAHNALVDQGHSFEEARRILRQHYQHIVIDDFLKRVCIESVVDNIVQNGNTVFDGLSDPFFMPIEFAVAAYRFGHTMVRPDYDFNVNFNKSGAPGTFPASVFLLFTFTALSGQLGDFDTLPGNWIIEWENVVDTGTGAAFEKTRRLDTKLAGHSSDNPGEASALFKLHDVEGNMLQPVDAARLAVRNLLRGYRLRVPTGQAIASFLGLPVLTPAEISAAADSPEQAQALQAGGFLDRTPLWYYILAEAKHQSNGDHLGELGSTLVAEVLIGLVRRSEDSILRLPGWKPSLPSADPDHFRLPDLLRFAGVLPGGTTAPTYVVQPGDTLSSIAGQQLGDANRWPEIFALNRAIIRNPNLIFPGQVLTLPSGPPAQPQPRFYVVQPGDTLSDIAQQELGDASRWPEIFALNGAILTNPDVIIPGQVLLLPS
jgi:nucleoid-associated protein YgaU